MSAACRVHARGLIAKRSHGHNPLPPSTTIANLLARSKISRRYDAPNTLLSFVLSAANISCAAVAARHKKQHSRQASFHRLALSDATGLGTILVSGVELYMVFIHINPRQNADVLTLVFKLSHSTYEANYQTISIHYPPTSASPDSSSTTVLVAILFRQTHKKDWIWCQLMSISSLAWLCV